MSTRSVIGEIRNGKVKAIYMHFDGYPSGVGADIQRWLVDHNNDVEAFLSYIFSHSQWRNLEYGYPETKGHAPEYTSIEDIAGDVMIEYAYIFNVDNSGFYVCDKNYETKRVLVIGGCKFDHIPDAEIDSLSEYEDSEDEDEEPRYRKMPELTLTGSQEQRP